MNQNQVSKNVYIFGNKNVGFLGFTYDKEFSKKIKKIRKNLKCVKIKNDERCQSILSINEEFFEPYTDIIMTGDEEQFYIESFIQFQSDVSQSIRILKNDYKFIKWNKKEKEKIKFLLEFLSQYTTYMEFGDYADDVDLNEIFNTEASMKYFVKHVLDGDK